jgi:hypothetical protein
MEVIRAERATATFFDGLQVDGYRLPDIQKVVTNSGRSPETTSLRDFNRLLSYAVFDGKKAALALQLALTKKRARSMLALL